MKFRNLIVALFSMLFLLFSWSILCTWKVLDLQKKHIAMTGEKNLDVVRKKLHEKYNEHNPVFDMPPPLGNWTYAHVEKYALKLGPDFQGGRIITLQANKKYFLESIGTVENPTFKKVLQETVKNRSQNASDDLLTTFLQKLSKKGPLSDFFSSSEIDSNASDTKVDRWVREQYQKYLKQCEKTLKNRLNPTKSEDNIVTLESNGTIEVQTGFGQDPKELETQITELGKLNFYKILDPTKLSKNPYEAIEKALKEEDNQTPISLEKVNYDPSARTYHPKDKEKIQQAAQNVLKSSQKLVFCKEKDKKGNYLVYIAEAPQHASYKKGYQIENAKVDHVKSQERAQGTEGNFRITVTLDQESGKKLKSYTGKGEDGLNAGPNNLVTLAIVLDDWLLQASRLKGELENLFSITGYNSRKEPENIAKTLRSGSLPIKLDIVGNHSIQPSLGKEAQKQGLLSVLLALLLLLLLMGIYYAGSGIIANVAIIFNIVCVLGSAAQLGLPLTLENIAGLLLTLGIGIDGLIIILSSARAAEKRGENPREALRYGFRHAYKSLVDSNITTLLAGLILFYLGNSSIRKFASTLITGLFTSLMTSVVLTHLLFDLIFAFMGPRGRLSFSFSFTRPFENIKIDLVRNKKRIYLVSFLFLSTGLGLLGYHGINVSPDFQGGARYIVHFDDNQGTNQQITAKDLEKSLKKDLKGSIRVNELEKNDMFTIVTTDPDIEENTIYDILQKATGKKHFDNDQQGEQQNIPVGHFIIESKSTIGGSIAGSTRKQAVWAILLALLVMLLYIFISFGNFDFALASLLALIHDILGIFAYLGFAKLFGANYELDLPLFICILTIFGYSINDTILFLVSLVDQTPDKKVKNIQPYINKTFSLTFERIFMTSISTALPLIVLFFFGGESLKGFSFPLLAGVISGTISSATLAPLLANDSRRLRNFLKRSFGKKSKETQPVST